MRLEVCSPRQDFGAEKLLEIALQHDMLQIRRKHPEIMRSSMKIMKDQLLINFWLSWNARRWRKTRSILALTTTRRRESHDPRIRKLTQMHCKVSSHSKPISSHFQCFDMFFFFFSFVCYTGRSGSFLTVLTKGPRSKDMKSFCTMSPPRGFSKALRPKGAIGAVRSLGSRMIHPPKEETARSKCLQRVLLVWYWNTSILSVYTHYTVSTHNIL